MFFLQQETILKENQVEDILSKYQKKDKLEIEISPNMQIDMIADIISDKLILKIKKSFGLVTDGK